jgi:hypothetical protein
MDKLSFLDVVNQPTRTGVTTAPSHSSILFRNQGRRGAAGHLSQLDGPTGRLLLQHYGNIRVCGQAHLVTFNASNEAHLDEMMMTLMSAKTVAFLELDPITFDAIDGTDVNAIGTDDLHVFFHLIRHFDFLLP